VFIQERLESGITFASLDSVTVNSADYTAATTVTAGTEGPEFTVPTFIPAGGTLVLTFTANVSADLEAGEYCNSFTTWQNGLPLTTGSLACLTVGAGKIGDTLYRDWDGNGFQDLYDIINGKIDVNGDGVIDSSDDLTTGGVSIVDGVVDLDLDGTAGETNGDDTGTWYGYNVINGLIDYDNDGTAGETNGEDSAQGGDEGLAGVSVQLWGPGPDGTIGTADDVLLKTDTTDSNGNYLFEGLDEGDYEVRVNGASVPSGYTLTGDPDETGTCSTCDAKQTVTLGFDQQYYDADFGYQPGGTGSIGDTVFEDLDQDGIQDAGEPGILAVDVILYEDTNGNGVIDAGDYLIATDTTDSNGNYSFTGLAEGLDYLVYMDLTPLALNDHNLGAYFDPYPYTSTTHPDATGDGYAIETVSNLSGAYNDADFGFRPIIPGSISGTAFQDENKDGAYNAGDGDVLLANVDVELYLDTDNDGVGDVLYATTTTDTNGDYTFSSGRLPWTTSMLRSPRERHWPTRIFPSSNCSPNPYTTSPRAAPTTAPPAAPAIRSSTPSTPATPAPSF
jgi:hypothetical protein